MTTSIPSTEAPVADPIGVDAAQTAVGAAGEPRRAARLHRLAVRLGPLARPLAGTRWLPLYAILEHTGRTSGRAYSTPVVARRAGDGFLIPLPFGNRTQWARNLEAAGGGTIRYRGRSHRVARPSVIGAEVARPMLSRVIGWLSAGVGIRHWIHLDAVDRPPPTG